MGQVKTADQRSRRRPLAQARTAVILDAAEKLFRKVGYARTTMEAIAAEAGVVVQTLYNTVGNKAALLSTVFERAVSGKQAPQPVPQFMAKRAAAAPTARDVIRELTAWFVEVHPVMAPIWAVVDEAAGHDVEVAAFARKRAHQRLSNYERAAAELRRRKALRKGLSLEEAAATIWSLGHPTVFRTLVIEARWPLERYAGWVDRALCAALLG